MDGAEPGTVSDGTAGEIKNAGHWARHLFAWEAVSVFLDHAVLAGIAHAQVHNQGNADHDGDVPVKATFPTAILEAQRDVFGGATEEGVGQRIGQGDAERANMRREKLRLHHSVDGSVAGD